LQAYTFNMQQLIDLGYLGLFIATFLAGSILPFSSELVLSGLLALGFNGTGCLVAATAGNVLGGMTCYWLGHLGKLEWIEKYLKIKEAKLNRILQYLHGKGSVMAFLTFVPIVGDLLAVGLGYLRANIWWVIVMMTLGKALRYFLWMKLTFGVMSWF
jgi:membrane protein YqaA with SNARE-associated domain